MAIYPTLSLLAVELCVSALTQGEEVVGRTRLDSLFKDSWLTAPQGDDSNTIVAPVFQREANAWSLAKKQDFIANVLNGKMKSLGHFIILNKRETGKYSLLDGQHRLTTIQKFINGEFTIKLAGRKKATQESLTEDEQELLANIIVDIKIYNNLAEEEEREKYNQLNLSTPLNNDAKLHALRSSTAEQPMFQLCDTIKTCEEEIYSRIRELLQINYDTKPQIYEGKILPLLSILITGDKLPNKKCVDLVIPDNMDERLRRFYEATMTLDSAKGELTRFIGGIAYDVQKNVDDADEMEAAIKRWQALIRQDKNTAVWARMVEGRPRWNRDAKKSEFEARCTRIRELQDAEGTPLFA